ncbi:DUF3987 domain-containing protein [Polynucleobacter sphagniphilus]|uniref:DUF3987 domain-containing protein n=1 Tax=Polynucleobacter sphagniphilus TaxID=1743169 RepID=UPI002475AFEE|nr:DUF3987 domain-containing protein [Polynucleobacter sphagniphilus]MDH6249771.1 hypothetical protein [Polynucleobacter sphagniphilus]MDH6300006.1 hypothetical protein [Polynucleobacter sphagniphilus]
MNLQESYVLHGFALVSIPSGSKGPKNKGWNEPENAITDPLEAANLKGNVGLAHLYCKRPTAVLDIDNYNLAKPWLAERGLDLDALLDAPDAVQISSGRPNRAKLLFQLPPAIKQIKTQQITDPETGEMVLEFRCASANGKTVQDLLPPSIHPETGQPYTWLGKGDWKHLPLIPFHLSMIWREYESRSKVDVQMLNIVTQDSLRLPDLTIQHLRSALLFMRSDERGLWIKVGMALKELNDLGRGLWLEWSATSDKFDLAEATKTWESFKPNTIGHQFVFAEAMRQGWTNPAKRSISVVPTYEGESTIGWLAPEKLPNELLPVESLDPSCLPNAIRDACVDIAQRLNCPLDYVALPALIGAGTALGNAVGILPKEHDDSWAVYCGFWGGIVGSPGSMKTPALQASLRPLQHLEEQAAQQYKQAYAQYLSIKKIYDAELAKFKSNKGPAPVSEPIKPIKKRLVVNDVTYQALGEILAENPKGVLALADELSGLLQSLDSPGQEAARGFYLSGWGGQGNYTFDRISRESITLTRYQLGVFGGFQPDRIRAYVKQSQGGSSKNDGLLQRFQLLAWPDLPEQFELIDRPANKTALDQMHSAITRLAEITKLDLPSCVIHSSGALLLHFEPAAQIKFNAWYVANENLLKSGKVDSAMHGHFAKYRSLIPGLALLFHLLDGHDGPVCEECFDRALSFAKYLKSHAKRIYASIQSQDYQPAKALAARLLNKKLEDGFTQRSLLHNKWSCLSTKEMVESALTILVEFGWLTEHETPSSAKGGRPTVTYKINPNISKELL